MWICGVGQLLPESPIHILLYQRVHQKGSKGIEGYDRLDKVKALHSVDLEGIKKSMSEQIGMMSKDEDQ